MRFVNVRELKSKTSEILRAAAGEEIVITNHGKPVALVTGIDAEDLGRIGRGGSAGRVAESSPTWGSSTATTESGAGPPSETVSPFPGESVEPGLRADAARPGDWNSLKAVFWDYPVLTDEEAVREFVENAHRAKDYDSYRWILSRFLERGRVVDVKKLFTWGEIRIALPHLKLTHYARKKWARMLEVYDRT